jgi:hypothetical protein
MSQKPRLPHVRPEDSEGSVKASSSPRETLVVYSCTCEEQDLIHEQTDIVLCTEVQCVQTQNVRAGIWSSEGAVRRQILRRLLK